MAYLRDGPLEAWIISWVSASRHLSKMDLEESPDQIVESKRSPSRSLSQLVHMASLVIGVGSGVAIARATFVTLGGSLTAVSSSRLEIHFDLELCDVGKHSTVWSHKMKVLGFGLDTLEFFLS
jgi:hypothetical protein